MYEEAITFINNLKGVSNINIIKTKAKAFLWLNRIDDMVALVNKYKQHKGIGYLSALAALAKANVHQALNKLEEIIDKELAGTTSDRALELYEQLTILPPKSKILPVILAFERLRYLNAKLLLLEFEKKLNGRFSTSLAMYFQNGFIYAEYDLRRFEALLTRLLKISKWPLDDFHKEKVSFLIGKILIEEFKDFDRGRRVLLTHLKLNSQSVFAGEIKRLLKN